MDKPTNPLTKTCTVCGQLKPLSAFQQLYSSVTGSYSNVCSTCRQAALDKTEEKDESTRSTTGFKIDNKAKVKTDADKIQHRKETEEQYFEERDKKDEISLNKTQEKEHIAQKEKDHRNTREKRSFLDRNDNTRRTATPPVFGGEEQQRKSREIRLDVPVIAPQMGEEKFKSSTFLQFSDLLGKNPFGNVARQQQTPNKTPAEKSPKETLIEDIKQNWAPKPKR